MRSNWMVAALVLGSSLAPACDVEKHGADTGGVDLGAGGSVAEDGGSGAGACGTEPVSSCADAAIDDASSPFLGPPVRGFVVVNSDYASSSVSVLSVTGEVLSASLISSASGDPGLSAALSGDIVLPTMPAADTEIVLIDRFPASVLTWVNLETAKVRAQLSVATGFLSNPHDYVPYSEEKAFVPRFEPNLDSGREPFDQGDDLLIVNPKTAEIVDRIDLAPALEGEPDGYHVRAGRAILAAGKLRVLSVGFNLDYTERLASRLITIDPESHAIEHVLVFEGMTSCSGVSLSPDGSELAIACNGAFGEDAVNGFSSSGVILVTFTKEAVEKRRWTSKALGIDPVSTVEWASRDHLIVLTYGRFDASQTVVEADDAARVLDVRSGTLGEPWLEAGPFEIGDVVCSPRDATCLVADAETEGGTVHVVSIESDGSVEVGRRVKPDPAAGLPPRSFGVY